MNENTIWNETDVSEKEHSQYLTFTLGHDIYGITVDMIREVNRYGKVFPVPKSPFGVSGIINLRGDVIPVIDLNARLFNTESKITKLTNIIILDLKQENEIVQIGAIIDSVKEVVDIRDEDIEIASGLGLNLRKDFVTGIGKVNSSFIILLDIQSVLNVDEISQSFSSADQTLASSILSSNDISENLTKYGD
jgi:purine-binding chemotaxis protein CheW